MRGAIVEEAYELVEAIDETDPAHVAEEAGDLLLNILMVAYMHEEEGSFSVTDCLLSITEKLVRRHPHVFGESKADTSEKVLAQWAEIKEKVEGRPRKDSILDDVSKAMPTLERAYKLQKKAAKAGFDWVDRRGPWDKAREELDEVEEAIAAIEAERAPAGGADGKAALDEGPHPRLEEELGDLLFSIVNISRSHGVDPSLALARANDKFARRFRHVERRMAESGQPMPGSALEVMDGYWEEAKALERKAGA
jgi:tetrapyrrole methylase family protein/MazG family protein